MKPPQRHRRLRAAAASALCTTLLALDAARAEPSQVSPEVGYGYGEVETARSVAMGGALRAFGQPTEGLYLNPANMAAQRVYHLSALGGFVPEARRQSYGLAAVDSIVSSSRLAGGLAFTWLFQDPEGIDREAKDLRFAFALPFGDQFFLGLGGRYLWLAQSGRGPLGDSAASSGKRDENIVEGFNFDAGATLKPVRSLALSVVGQNLTNPGHGFSPTSLGGGIAVGNENGTLEVDALADFDTWGETTARVMAGGELLAADHYPLRAGYRWDQGARQHSISAGLGYLDRAFAAEVGLRRSVSGERATTITISLRYHLEGAGLATSPDGGF